MARPVKLVSRRYRRRLLASYPWLPVAALCGATLLVALIAHLAVKPGVQPRVTTTPKPTPVTVSTTTPSEVKPTANYRSAATGAEPKYLKLPTIGAEGYVQSVGIDQNKQVAVPTNIYVAGWFATMVRPGESGLSIIDGHLDGRSQPGIFAHLDKLKPKDVFTVDQANGTTRRFQVVSVRSLPVAQAAAELFSQDPTITSQLNLVTCAGTFKGSKGYDQRVIVVSRLVK